MLERYQIWISYASVASDLFKRVLFSFCWGELAPYVYTVKFGLILINEIILSWLWSILESPRCSNIH